MNDTTDKMYEYLVEKYPKSDIEKLENGGYFVTLTGTRGDQIYIPAEFNSDSISIMSYFPGQGGNKAADANQVRSLIYSDNPPNTIITISSEYYDPGKVMMQASTIANDNNLEVSNVSIQTFSASGPLGFNRLKDFMEVNPNTKATVVVADGFGNNNEYNRYNDFLIENDIDVIYVLPKGKRGDFYPVIEKMGASGVDTYIMLTDPNVGNAGYHMNVNNDLIKNGFLLYTLGLSDELSGPTLDKCNYSLRVYDPTNPNADKHGFVIIDSMEAIQQENSSFGYNLSKLESNPFEVGTIASDMYLTISSINNIRNAMGVNDFQSTCFQSTTTIPRDLFEAQSSLFGISADLSSNLLKETEVIATIAQVFYDMDRERTNASNQLGASFDATQYINAMDQLITADLSSIRTFKDFMFDPKNQMVGNTGKIYLSDLTSMLSGSALTGALHENFESERENATKTKNEIDNLINLIEGNSNFQGESWEKVKAKLNTYSDLMSIRIYSVGVLEHAMIKALNLLISYMEDYTDLDDSKLGDLKETIDKTKKEIVQCQEIINATHVVEYPYKDVFGNTSYNYKTEYLYSLETRTTARQTLDDSMLLLEEMLKQVSKMEGMSIVIAEAEQIINDALYDVYNKYASKVSDLVTGTEASYIPPQNSSYVSTIYPVPEKIVIPEPNSDKHFWSTGHVSEEIFNSIPALKNKWGSYDDYLNGVMAENNPKYNVNIKDNGIKLDDNPGDEPKPDGNPGDEPKPDGNPGDEPKPDGNPGDEPKPDGNPGDEPKPDGNPGDKPKPDGNPGDEPKPDGNPGDEPKPDGNPGDETKPDGNPGDEPKPDGNPGDEPKPDGNPGDEPKPDGNPGDETKPDGNPGDETKPDSNPGDEPKPDGNPGDETKPDGNPNDDKSENKTGNEDNSMKDTPNIFESNQGNNSNENVTGDDIISNEENTNSGDIIEELPGDQNQTESVPPVIEIPDDVEEIVDITPPSVKDDVDSSNGTSQLIKNIGIGVGVSAAVGATTLGAHTYKKAKENDIYED